MTIWDFFMLVAKKILEGVNKLSARLWPKILPSDRRQLISKLLSVTRFGDLLHFGQLCKACGNNYFAQIAHMLGMFVKVSKSFIFLVE